MRRRRFHRFWKREPEYPSGPEMLEALDANGWHAGRAARALGISRTTLWRHLAVSHISLRKEKKKVWSDFWFQERLETANRKRREWTLKQTADF
ncbi:MAG TPA: helix-turn-helix domain-containing protein [Gemmatimonadales bacterium]|nr:helix-turn-helix domain-containing protein [Gemmatimonadales bacterium]